MFRGVGVSNKTLHCWGVWIFLGTTQLEKAGKKVIRVSCYWTGSFFSITLHDFDKLWVLPREHDVVL